MARKQVIRDIAGTDPGVNLRAKCVGFGSKMAPILGVILVDSGFGMCLYVCKM